MSMDAKYKSVQQSQIDELVAIYNDYLCIAREHEHLLQTKPQDELAGWQVMDMYDQDPKFMWQVYPLSPQEQQDFRDFINNDVSLDKNRAYILLQHVRPTENTGLTKIYSVPPYVTKCIGMQMPSLLEQFTIMYSHDVTLGNIEIFVDGMYKVKYNHQKDREKLFNDCLHDQRMIDEISICLNLVDAFRQSGSATNDKFDRLARDVYASEKVQINENFILEIMGSFAEKIFGICCEIYPSADPYDKHDSLAQAEADGFIPSADDFQDYLNIRNLMRHQWDSLHQVGMFNKKKSDKRNFDRSMWIKSYMKLCDKSLKQRMKSYIEILHQMQHVLSRLCPDRIIRNVSESNNKFVSRARVAYQQNPNTPVEINQPFADEKYQSLNKSLRKLCPDINIVDDIDRLRDVHTKIDEYSERSYFLQNFHDAEFEVELCCMMRGRRLYKSKAWDYMVTCGVLSPEEKQKWHDYAILRNVLSHNYFNQEARARVIAVADEFWKDLNTLGARLRRFNPDVKLQHGIYEFKHHDGLIVHIDSKTWQILDTNRTAAFGTTNQTEPAKNEQKIQSKTYPNGVKIDMLGTNVVGVTLPNGINIDLANACVHWDRKTHWFINAEKQNVLQTENSKIFTDAQLRATKYVIRDKVGAISRGDNLLIDNRHRLTLDSMCRIKDFKFKNSANLMLRSAFMYKDGKISIMFDDGTIISQTKNGLVVSHNGLVLNKDNCQQFVSTYINPQNVLQQTINNGHSY